MTDNSNTGDKTIHVPQQRKPLGLKPRGVERDTVRQSFSHGRTNTVQVERKKRRIVLPGETAKPEQPQAAAPRPPSETVKITPRDTVAPSPPKPSPRAGLVLRQLSEEEMDARARALADARVHEAEERRAAEEQAARRKIEAERLAREREEAERRKVEEEARRKTEDVARVRAEDTARRRLGDEKKPDAEQPQAGVALRPVLKTVKEEEEEERGAAALRGRVKTAPTRVAEPKPVKRVEDRRRGKLTLSTALDDSERARSLTSIRRRRERDRARAHEGPREKIIREVIIPETITIQELANRMAERAVDVIKLMMKQGQILKAADVIEADMAQLIAEDMGHTVRRVAESDVEEGLYVVSDAVEDLESRAPVVTIMGHVDHGKTSLLDAIRQANVVSGEAGGITQHIGAYQVEQNGHKVTFIDTPGHAAFTAMRARGAKVTDIVVLVVAADDGVMPQTIEAINHAKAAKVPIIVAINKIDKPDAEPQRVRTELLQHEVFVETMGGDVLDVEVSALKHTNLDRLIETILLQSEVLELKANPNRPAEGTVIEAKLDRGRGPVATVLVQAGTVRVGDILVAGSEWGKVRALLDDHGESVKDAGPSMPVEVLGFQGAPEAGDRFAVVESRIPRPRDHRLPYPPEAGKDGAKMTGARGSLSADDEPAPDLGSEDLPAGHQGRRAGLGRGDRQALDQARHR
jgi:translation initiation factor IF-2